MSNSIARTRIQYSYFLDLALVATQGLLASIRRDQSKLLEAHEKSKTVTRSEEMKVLREQMQSDINAVNKTAHIIKSRLEVLDKNNATAVKQPVSRLRTPHAISVSTTKCGVEQRTVHGCTRPRGRKMICARHAPSQERRPEGRLVARECMGVMHAWRWCNDQGCGVGSSSERTRTAITAALRKKLKDLMGEFQELRQKLQDEYRWGGMETLRGRRHTLFFWGGGWGGG
jgi:Syntaxin